jgi:hypothetical protein
VSFRLDHAGTIFPRQDSNLHLPRSRRSNRSLHHRPILLASSLAGEPTRKADSGRDFSRHLVLRDYAPGPWNSDPRQGRRPARRLMARSISPIHHRQSFFNSLYKDHFGQGTGSHGRAFAHEDSNLTARRLFHPEKYPWLITTDRRELGWGNEWQRWID